MSETITQAALRALVAERLSGGQQVVGPVSVTSTVCMYRPLEQADELILEGFVRPRNSIKPFFFPQHEPIMRYHFEGSEVVVENIDPEVKPFICMAMRPCDSAALPLLDNVFSKENPDASYEARRAAGTVVTMACSEHDRDCFCTLMDLRPDTEKGADAMLLLRSDGDFEVRTFTDKGIALFEGKTVTKDESPLRIASKILEGFTLEQIKAFLADHFEDRIWNTISMPCLGCGSCAYSCPTCHCFDIVDEGNAAGGCRVRNWDSCQLCMFTLHASGHNPRSCQADRQRQRIQHKFHFFPDKYGEVLCTGCGNCTNNCPVGLGVLTALRQIAGLTFNKTPEA